MKCRGLALVLALLLAACGTEEAAAPDQATGTAPEASVEREA